ncbi:MAG: hypothetical protein H0Z29_06765 [Candidatus Marinimicrobia bacterium]|nr:hypothetical protein [Candidatus Neomarinimicrobiota bacterium]
MAVIVALLEKSKKFDKESFLNKFNINPSEIRILRGGEEELLVIHIPDSKKIDMVELISFDSISKVYDFTKSYKLIHREIKPEGYSIKLKNTEISALTFTPIISFNIENVNLNEIKVSINKFISKGIKIIYLKNKYILPSDIEFLKKFIDTLQDVAIIFSINSPDSIVVASKYVDAYVIEQNQMQNFSLLRALGKTRKPVIVKKAPAASIEEYLLSVEYIIYEGNLNVILCESGTLTVHNRVIPDIEAILYMKEKTYLPVLMDIENFETKKEIDHYLKIARNLELNGIIVDYKELKQNSINQIY